MKTINSHNIVWEEFEKCFWVVMILCCLQIQLQWLWRNFCMFNPVLWHRITARCNIISTKYFVALLVHIMSYWENSKTNQDLKLIRRVQREKRDCCNGISSLQRMLKKIWAYSILASLSSNFDAWNFSRLVQFYKCIVKGEKQSSYLCWDISFTRFGI